MREQQKKPFAKLFESDELGQILVKKDTNDNGEPEIRFYFQPPHDALGVCSVALGFNDEDEDEAWRKCDTAFDRVTQGLAEQVVRNALAETSEFMGETAHD